MSCPAPERLAAAATEGDDAILAHAVSCEHCLLALDDQRSLRALVQRSPVVVLTRDRRELMAAEIMAQADRLPAAAPREPDALPVLTRERRDAMAAELMAQADQLDVSALVSAQRAARRRTVTFVVAGLAAAAALVIVLATRGGSDPGSKALAGGSNIAPGSGSGAPHRDVAVVTPIVPPIIPSTDLVTPEPVPEPVVPERVAVPAPTPSRAKLEGSGDYARDARDARASRDVVRLRGGELSVDSTGSRPVEIISGGTAIAVKKARVKVIATKGVVSSVAVFAGSAEVTIDGHRVIVEAGTVWERDVARDDALAAFRSGWTALRAGNNDEAIAAFDRATDPIVAEDATYWAAIASERAGDTAGAVRRYRDLLARFPKTTRTAEAKTAITRLAP